MSNMKNIDAHWSEAEDLIIWLRKYGGCSYIAKKADRWLTENLPIREKISGDCEFPIQLLLDNQTPDVDE